MALLTSERSDHGLHWFPDRVSDSRVVIIVVVIGVSAPTPRFSHAARTGGGIFE
jgi:hypothetical protein